MVQQMIADSATEMIGRVADRGIQVFGGMGFCKDLPLEPICRDSRVTRLDDGVGDDFSAQPLHSGFVTEAGASEHAPARNDEMA